MQDHCGVVTQVVKHRGGVVKKQRQVVFNTGRGDTGPDVFVNAAAGGVAFEQFTPAAAKTGACVVVHGELAPWQQAHFGHRVQAALAVGVEGADAVDLVVKQVHPVRHQRAHGKQVNQAATHRVFAGADHLRHMAVAGQRQLCLELGLVEFLLDLEVERGAGQKTWRCQSVQCGGGRHHDHIGAGVLVALADAPQGGQALADQVLMR